MPPCPPEALISYLGEVLPRMAGTQERYKVTEVPTIRTLRFYGSQGLVDKPLIYEGRTALYGYRHLLQVVVIKVLQASHLPLRKIREMLLGRSIEDLERLLEVSKSTGRAGEFEVSGPPASPPGEAPTRMAQGSGLASPLLQELLNVKLNTFPVQQEPGPIACGEPRIGLTGLTTKTTAWRRLEVEPGVELHLREDIAIKPGSRLEVLLTRIKHLLSQQSPD